MSGHLFVTRGDLRHLACDAVLFPSGSHNGRRGHVSSTWDRLDAHRDGAGYVTPAPEGSQRVVRVVAGENPEPAIWLGHTGDTGTEPPEWYAHAIREFVREASHMTPAGDGVRPFDDSRPLLAVPLVGTGRGGMAARKGEVVVAIVDAIVDELRNVDADVVLVLNKGEAYAAAQQARARHGDQLWSELTQDDRKVADELAADARRRKLVLFMGAGTGLGAGLPNWRDLLVRLGAKAGLDDQARKELLKMDPRDAGLVLERRMASPEGWLATTIKEIVTATNVSLVHQLLASLPTTEAVTTNYDELFERAWRDAGRSPVIVPQRIAHDAESWLLKLHGSVDDPDRIVLSRGDYLRFEGSGVALAGIVQAMLLTRHMLFVGYSLSDDNFHRLVHQVHDALGDALIRHGGGFGTALTPKPLGLYGELWQEDVRYVSTADGGDKDPRRLAILLDRIGWAAATPAAHMLNPAYKAVFSDDEWALRECIDAVKHAAQADGVRPQIRGAVAEAIATLQGDRANDIAPA